jgi:hypothetical protein
MDLSCNDGQAVVDYLQHGTTDATRRDRPSIEVRSLYKEVRAVHSRKSGDLTPEPRTGDRPMKVSDCLALDCLSVADEIVARRQDDHFDRDTELFQVRRNWRPPFLDVNEYLHERRIMAP